jgi:hypothetical protein
MTETGMRATMEAKRPMKSAVVNGSLGTIGLALVEKLLERGIRVFAVYPPDSARIDRFPHGAVPVPCDMRQIESLAERIQPACLLVLDALCAADSRRLCNTVQLCDSGITPGEGTGTARCRLDREALGIPVIALGIPTVTDVSTLVREQTGMKAREPGWLVTRSDIDGLLRHCVNLVSRAVNLALHPGLSARELALLLES